MILSYLGLGLLIGLLVRKSDSELGKFLLFISIVLIILGILSETKGIGSLLRPFLFSWE